MSAIPFPKYDLNLIGSNFPSEYFKENYLTQFRPEFLSVVTPLGYKPEWIGDDETGMNRVHSAFLLASSSGTLTDTLKTNAPVTHTPYTGPKYDNEVMSKFNQWGHMLGRAMFIITEGQDWWPYEKTFLTDNTDNIMKYYLYHAARANPSILNVKRAGRPRNADSQKDKAKEANKGRYQEWLVLCAEYRAQLEEYKEAYQFHLQQYSDFKAQGAKTWQDFNRECNERCAAQ